MAPRTSGSSRPPGGPRQAPAASWRRPRPAHVVGGVVLALALTALGARACTPGGSVGHSAREMRELHVGDCVKILPRPDKGRGAAGGMNITHDKVDCATAGVVTYEVGAIGHGALECPNPNYQQYWENDDTDQRNPRRWTACLMPNLQPGSCYQPDNLTRAFVVARCGPDSLFKVEGAYEGDDPRRCTGASEPFNFPVPARTFCVTSQT